MNVNEAIDFSWQCQVARRAGLRSTARPEIKLDQARRAKPRYSWRACRVSRCARPARLFAGWKRTTRRHLLLHGPSETASPPLIRWCCQTVFSRSPPCLRERAEMQGKINSGSWIGQCHVGLLHIVFSLIMLGMIVTGPKNGYDYRPSVIRNKHHKELRGIVLFIL